MINSSFETQRLTLKTLTPPDAEFIYQLLNTPGWKRFIGDRNINDLDDALKYIKKINSNDCFTYWVVTLKKSKVPIGIVTLIKREFLDFHDIGFAFLPEFEQQGFAWESSKVVLEAILHDPDFHTILATTKPENTASIKLIEKLGLTLFEVSVTENGTANIYKIESDKKKIDILVQKFFSAFSNRHQKADVWAIANICVDETVIIKSANGHHEVYSLPSFIKSRQEILTGGRLTEFEEYEEEESTVIKRNIGQRISGYRKSGIMEETYFERSGTKMFQFIKTGETWKISSVMWDDEDNLK